MLLITVKFILFFSLIIVGYLAAAYLKDYNNFIHIEIFDYSIDLNIIVMIGALILLILISNVLIYYLKCLILIPYRIIRGYNKAMKNQPEKFLVNCYAKFLKGEKNLSSDQLSKALLILPEEYMGHIHFLLINVTEDFGQKITSLNYLIKLPEYKFIAQKKLAELYLSINHLEKAKSLIETLTNSSDLDVLLIALDIYAKMKAYTRFSGVVGKITRLDKAEWQAYNNIIANHYFDAANDLLLNGGSHQEIKSYLESALLYKPDMIKAIDAYCRLNIYLSQAHNNIELIENSFSQFPSFELFELYLHFSKDDNQQIFYKLSSLIEANDNIELLLAISARLKLFIEIEKILASKLLIT